MQKPNDIKYTKKTGATLVEYTFIAIFISLAAYVFMQEIGLDVPLPFLHAAETIDGR